MSLTNAFFKMCVLTGEDADCPGTTEIKENAKRWLQKKHGCNDCRESIYIKRI